MVVYYPAGENQVQTEEISRGHAGAAVGKVICPPAYSVDNLTEWHATVPVCGVSRAHSWKRGTEKPCETIDPRCITASYAYGRPWVGLTPAGSQANVFRHILRNR